jgi:hypothetical protein
MASITIYAGSGDGYAVASRSSGDLWTFATWRANTDGGGNGYASTIGTTSNEAFFGGAPSYGKDGNGSIAGSRFHFPFDCSAIGAGAVISAATLNFASDASQQNTTGTDYSMEIVKSTVTSNTELAKSDHPKVEDTKLATGIAFSSLKTTGGQYNVFTLNASGLATVDPAGWTKLALRWQFDVENTDPTVTTGRMHYQFRTSEYTGTASDPYLEITYTEAPPATAAEQQRSPSGGAAYGGGAMMY